MKYILCSVRDIVSGEYCCVNIFKNQAIANRWFEQLLAESKISTDLQFYKVGTFDVETGSIEPCCDFIRGANNE